MNRAARWGIGICTLLAAAAARADTVYVTDQLRLGMHRQDDTGDRAFRTLLSGTELELLNRNTFYAQVRAPDGAEGWVKATYLVADKPAVLRVAEVEANNERLSSDLNSARQELSATRKKASDLEGRIDSALSQANENTETLARLQEENQEFRERFSIYRTSVPLSWFLAAMGVVMVLGFIGGFAWLDHRTRKRFGGFRVY